MSEPKAPRADEPRALDLLDRAERFPLAGETFARWESVEAREPSLPMFVRTELPTNVNPEAWTYLVESHEYELPPPLFDDIKHRVPQALLRDLHRPEKKFYVTPEPVEGTIEPGQVLHRALADVRAARRPEERPTIEPSIAAVAEAQRQRRTLLAERWEPALPDDAPRKNVVVYPTFDDDKL